MAGRPRPLGSLERALQGGETLRDDVEFFVAERLQQGADGLLARRRPVGNALAPLRGDAQPDKAAVAGIAVLANDPLSREPGHQDRHAALRQPGQPGQFVDRDTGVLGDLPHGGQGRAVHGNGNCSAVASCTCWRRKPRTASLSSLATWLCASWRPEAASPAATARVVVSYGTFTPQHCRRLSQTRRDRRPRGTGPWFAAGITLFGYALSAAAEPGSTPLFAAFRAVPGLPQARRLPLAASLSESAVTNARGFRQQAHKFRMSCN